jgi:hypothetical protein
MAMTSILKDTDNEEQENHKYGLIMGLPTITENDHEKVVPDNISRILGAPTHTMTEMKEGSKVIHLDGVQYSEGAKEVSRSHDHHSNEEKLGTIKEVP